MNPPNIHESTAPFRLCRFLDYWIHNLDSDRSTFGGRGAQPRPDLEAYSSKLIHLQDQYVKLRRKTSGPAYPPSFLPHIAFDYSYTPRRLSPDR